MNGTGKDIATDNFPELGENDNYLTAEQFENKIIQKVKDLIEVVAKIDEVKNTTVSRGYRVVLPRRTIEDMITDGIAYEAQSFTLAGFRKGKAPLSIVRNQKGAKIQNEILDKVIGGLIHKLVVQKGLRLASAPKVGLEAPDNDDLVCNMELNLLPAVPKVDFTDPKFTIEVFELKVTDNDIEQAHKTILGVLNRSHKKAEEGHQAQIGDILTIDFVGFVDGQEFEGNKADGIQVVIGNGVFLQEFEEKLIGAQAGETRRITVTFPADYQQAQIAGKLVDFDITIHEILTPDDNAVMNEQIAQQIGAKDLDELEKMITQKIQEDYRVLENVRRKDLLFRKLDEILTFEIPEELINNDLNAMLEDLKRSLEADGAKSEEINQKLEERRPELERSARLRVKVGLILADVASSEEIKIDESDYEAAKQHDIAKSPDKKKEIEQFYSHKESRDRLYSILLEDKVVKFIYGKIPLQVKELTSDELNKYYAQDMQKGRPEETNESQTETK